jgi:hypothetical protein
MSASGTVDIFNVPPWVGPLAAVGGTAVGAVVGAAATGALVAADGAAVGAAIVGAGGAGTGVGVGAHATVLKARIIPNMRAINQRWRFTSSPPVSKILRKGLAGLYQKDHAFAKISGEGRISCFGTNLTKELAA